MQGGGWPENELEQVLGAALGAPEAGARIVEVLGRSRVWVPLPGGGGPDSPSLALPTMDIGGAAYVPVYSSESQLRACAGPAMDFAVAPAVEFARGLPPQLGIAVNPEGAVGVPLPPAAVALPDRRGRGVPRHRRRRRRTPLPRQRRGRRARALHRCPAGGMGTRHAKRPVGGPRPGPRPRSGALAGALDPARRRRGPGGRLHRYARTPLLPAVGPLKLVTHLLAARAAGTRPDDGRKRRGTG